MFTPANQAHFSLRIENLRHDFQVFVFHGRETISQSFRLGLELISERSDLGLDALLHQPALLILSPSGQGVHGQLTSITQGDSGRRLTGYHATLEPRLAYLGLCSDQRVFQRLSVPGIIGRVLEGHGILADAYRFQLGPTSYPAREYCTQYNETDSVFLSRLCGEEGIHYHHGFSAQGHVLVLGDDQTSFPRLQRPVTYVQDARLVADQLMVKRFGVRFDTRANRVTRRDYDFEQSVLQMQAARGPQLGIQQPDLEDYDCPGRFTHRERGKHLSRRALERHRADYLQARGESDELALLSGHFLTLSAHPRGEWNDLWLPTEVLHGGWQPQALEESIDSDVAQGRGDFRQGYRSRFVATPWSTHFCPPPEHPKPRVLGCQTAVVTGSAGETIYCDRYGRVRVQFLWDRLGQVDDNTSCWSRVASNWAGKRYGGVAIPRVDVEVLVGFLEGDPDQPLATDCLYHSENRVPYELPRNKTHSIFETDSYPGGGGPNELRIEGRKGQEQIFVHAQRDWDENIEHDQKVRVGHERRDTVEGNSYSKFRAEEQRAVHADRKVELKAADHLSVTDALHLRIGTGQFAEVGDEIHFKAGDKVVIEAGVELTLKGGGSFARLDPGGVTLDGAQVMINSGGNPGIGSGVRALSPPQPLAAGVAAAGDALLGTIAQRIGEAPQKLLRFELSPLPGMASAARQPYRLYANGAFKEEGIVDEGGAISFEPLPGERTYRIETANDHAYEVEMADQPDALQADDWLARRGFRDYRAEMPQHKPCPVPDAYRRGTSRPGAADKDDPTS